MNDYINNLNKITATKEEYAKSEEMQEIKRWIDSISYNIKADIEEKAKSGQYVVEGSKKKISGYVGDLWDYILTNYHRDGKIQINETLYARTGLGIFKGPNQQTFERKATVTPWFLKVLSLTTSSLEDEGLKGIKIFNVFEYKGKRTIGNSMIFKGEERVSDLDNKEQRKRGSERAYQCLYYEFRY